MNFWNQQNREWEEINMKEKALEVIRMKAQLIQGQRDRASDFGLDAIQAELDQTNTMMNNL